MKRCAMKGKTVLACALSGALGLVALSGCATAVRGTTELFAVRSTPPGALASSSTGWECTTPCKVKVKRRGDFVVLLRKEGYVEETVKVLSVPVAKKRSMRERVGVDVGWIGQAADYATGANYEHTPNPLDVTLVPAK